MRRCLFVAICLASSLASADAPIIGGTATKVGDFPTTVGVEFDIGGGFGVCTGELIAPDWVVTAGHCVDPDETGAGSVAALTAAIKVHFDTVSFGPFGTSDGKVVRAKEIFEHPMHPNFQTNVGLGSHDIGLIHLASSITDRTPALINLHHADAPVGVVVTMVGYGVTQENPNQNSSFGIEFVVKNRTSEDCALTPPGIPAPSNNTALCFSQTDNKGKCQGDSGGPSFASINGVTKIVGITSYGDTGCTAFGADTRPDAERDFILLHIPDVECQSDADCASAQPRTCFNHQCLLEPGTPGAIGETCTGGSDCDNGTCGTGPAATGSGTEMLCTVGCTPGADNACPSGFDCLAAGSSGACWPGAGGDSGGCCDAGSRGAPTAFGGMLLLGLVLRRRRR